MLTTPVQTMKKDINSDQDSAWKEAWAWVIKEHENKTLDKVMQREFEKWLTADSAHKLAYEKASRLWLFAGLVPPVNEIPAEDSSPDDK